MAEVYNRSLVYETFLSQRLAPGAVIQRREEPIVAANLGRMGGVQEEHVTGFQRFEDRWSCDGTFGTEY